MIRGLLLCGLWVGTATAHPAHVAYAEVHHRPARGVLEVALYATIHDLEAALSRQAKRDVFLDETAGKKLPAYLADTFVVTGADGKPRPVRWVGHEAKVHDAWLYFEVPLRSTDGAHLRFATLFELSPLQVNTARLGDRTLTFTAGQAVQPLALPR